MIICKILNRITPWWWLGFFEQDNRIEELFEGIEYEEICGDVAAMFGVSFDGLCEVLLSRGQDLQ